MVGLFDIAGRNALVTGGSRGVGAMIARGLAEAGAYVFISSRKEAELLQTAEELSALGSCEAIPADLSTPDGARALPIRSANGSTRSASSSTTPARPGAPRSRSSPSLAGIA